MALDEVGQETPFSLRGLPTDPRDAAFIRFVLDRLPHIPSVVEEHPDPGSFMQALSECSLLVGMRLHALILAASVKRLPICGFLYSNKTQTFVREAGLEQVFFPMNTTDTAAIVAVIRESLSGEIPPPSLSEWKEESLRQRAFLTPFLKP